MPTFDEVLELVRADLRREEGLRLTCYKCSEGVWTIGYGRNIQHKGISRAEAEFLFANDIQDVIADLDRELSWWRTLSADHQRALMLLCFQLGIPKLKQFHGTLAAIQGRNGPAAAAHALDSLWARQTPARARRVATLLERG